MPSFQEMRDALTTDAPPGAEPPLTARHLALQLRAGCHRTCSAAACECARLIERVAGVGAASSDDAECAADWKTKRKITHDEAWEIATRLINSHFRQEPHARVGIPARPDYDDDLLISAYIEQQRATDTELATLRADRAGNATIAAMNEDARACDAHVIGRLNAELATLRADLAAAHEALRQARADAFSEAAKIARDMADTQRERENAAMVSNWIAVAICEHETRTRDRALTGP